MVNYGRYDRISTEKWMEIHRRRWLRNAKTPLQVKFGDDPEVYDFAVKGWKYLVRLNNGNAENIWAVSYTWFAEYLSDPVTYRYMLEEFSGSASLTALMRKLHRRYAKLTIPRYG